MTRLPVNFIFSQSSLQDYSDCPRRFQLRYLEHLAWPAVEQEPFLTNEQKLKDGDYFHHLVNQYWLGLPSDRLTQMARSVNLHRWWENFVSSHFDLDGFDLHPEVTLGMKVGDWRLIAKYDLLAVNSNQVRIFDWKTNEKLPRKETLAIRYQTRVYPLLMVESGQSLSGRKCQPDEIDMIYWFANFPDTTIQFQYSDTQFRRDREHIFSLISRIGEEENFPLTIDEKRCTYCPYRSYCDRGISAGSSLEDSEDQTNAALDWDSVPEIEF